jgi:hypothetical protein
VGLQGLLEPDAVNAARAVLRGAAQQCAAPTRQHEIAYLALRHTLLQGRVLRSTDPAGLQQEMWALLTLYQTLRRALVTAVESVPGTDPDRASFTTALSAAQDLLVKAEIVITDSVDLVGDIGHAVLADLLPPRRPRTSVRKVKSPLSRYNKKDPYRPDHSTPITALTITVNDPDTPRPATPRKQRLTTASGPQLPGIETSQLLIALGHPVVMLAESRQAARSQLLPWEGVYPFRSHRRVTFPLVDKAKSARSRFGNCPGRAIQSTHVRRPVRIRRR